MKREMISQAMDQLDMKYINEALEEGARTRKASRRALTGILAAAAVLVCTMGIAMAASPTVRAAVLTFFHLEESEQVPGPGDMAGDGSGTPTVIGNDIGGQVKAQYIQVDDAWYQGYNNSDVELGEDGSVRTFCFWNVEDGVLTRQEVEPQESTFSVTWHEMEYRGTFFWCVRDGAVSAYSDGYDPQTDRGWDVQPIPGRTDTAILYVYQGTQLEYSAYTLLYHLDTGEVEDILAGTGVEALEYAYDYAWTKDLSGLIVTCRDGELFDSAKSYYCDVTAKTLTEIGTLTGTDANYAFFADDETLIVDQFTNTEVSVWSHDLATGQTVPVLTQAHVFSSNDEAPYGIMFFGARYGVYVEQSGETAIFDFETGQRSPVEDFTFQRGGSFLSNVSNSKLLYWVSDSSADGLGVSGLGVLDMEKGTFLAFDREGYDTLYEWMLGWFDDNRVAIHSRTPDGESLYLYLYEF